MKLKYLSLFSVVLVMALASSSAAEGAEVQISGVYYTAADEASDFIEIYIYNASGGINLSGWYVTTFDGDNETLPFISGLGDFDYIAIRMGPGVNDLDASDGNATVYLNISSMLNAGDEVGLYNNEAVLVDFIRYGGGNGDPVLGNWPGADAGIAADNEMESIQIHGRDLDNSSNWFSASVSEAASNHYDFFMPAGPGINVTLINGINTDYNITARLRTINHDIQRLAGGVVNAGDLLKVEEMLNFSWNYYEALGFPLPLMPTGRMRVRVNRNGQYDAVTSDNGMITVNLGGNDWINKWSIEHEFYHAIQLNSPGKWNPITNSFLDEGPAEYWSSRITMKQYNITEEQLLNESAGLENVSIPTYDFDGALNDMDGNFISDWNDDYEKAFLLAKYIVEKYGEEKLLHIFNISVNNGSIDDIDPGDITGIGAIDEALRNQSINKTFNDTFAEWTEWVWRRYNDSIALTMNETFDGTSVLDESDSLQPWGTDYERIEIKTNNTFKIEFQGNPNKTYSIIIIMIRHDGTEERKVKMVKGWMMMLVHNDYKEVILIKSQIDSHIPSDYTLTVEKVNDSSVIDGSVIENSTIENSTVLNSTVTDSVLNDSVVKRSLVNGSNLENTMVIDTEIVQMDLVGMTVIGELIIPDRDHDVIEDSGDNCPGLFNPGQEDWDEDGIGDGCDNCPKNYNPGQGEWDCTLVFIIPTTAVISGEGVPPVIQHVWVLPDEDPIMEGVQVWPALSDERNDIYACIVASDPQGRGDIQNVYMDVYHPDGSFKYQVHAERLNISEEREEIEQCKLDALEAGLITQEQFDEIDYQIFNQPGWYMYKVYLPMLYHQPAGWYEARAWATDTSSGVSSKMNAYFEWVSTVAVQLDFTTLEFGEIQPSVFKVIQGDYDMGTGSAPTVKNEGNEPAEISVHFSEMVGKHYKKIIDDFDIQFLDEHVYLLASEIYAFLYPLELCQQEKLDFSVHADVGIPSDTYIGDVIIYASAY